MIKPLLISFLFLLSAATTQCQDTYPKDVEDVLIKSGGNRAELENVLKHYQQSQADSLKLKAAYFLVSNMDIHRSASYYWADTLGNRVRYDELSYPDFNTAVHAFDSLKLKVKGIHPVSCTYRDIDSIKASYLIDNIDRAFAVWKKPAASALSFKDFCEYLLPYRISVEPLQSWRKIYEERFAHLSGPAQNTDLSEWLVTAASDYQTWFKSTWSADQRREPLPYLGPLQLLFRKKGICQDIAVMQALALRSIGVPSSFNFIPYWATAAHSHFLNSAFYPDGRAVPFDVLSNPVVNAPLMREPAKVLRATYAKQANTLAATELKENIPPGFLREQNYTDITEQYWPAANLKCLLFPDSAQTKTVYACVFNAGKWRPVWWGKPKEGSVTFSKMCAGAVYMPAYYESGKMVPAGYPSILTQSQQKMLKPDKEHRVTITLKEQDKYLIYRPGSTYKLKYWDKKWIILGEQKAAANTHELVFKNVPAGALCILSPDYSQHMERPFTINQAGERIWW